MQRPVHRALVGNLQKALTLFIAEVSNERNPSAQLVDVARVRVAVFAGLDMNFPM